MTEQARSEIIKRALMTAVEGFFSVLIPEFAYLFSNGFPEDLHVLWITLAPFIGAGIGAGISAGWNYYLENKVRYLCIDGTHGYAIVEGNEAYEVEFEYRNGEISSLVCSCFCSYNCKHEFAAMLQLKETLENIEKNYAEEYENSSYFAAVNKATLFEFAVSNKDSGTFTL